MLAASAALAGCGSSSNSASYSGDAADVGPDPELVAMRRPPVDDLPVPIGFYLDEGRSRNLAVAGARFIDHAYRGKADKFAVGRFYKRQMPISRWTLVTDRFTQGEILQDYEKGNERCRVSISDSGGLFPQTIVKLAIWTSGRAISSTSVSIRSARAR